jgi:hypothetical protein
MMIPMLRTEPEMIDSRKRMKQDICLQGRFNPCYSVLDLYQFRFSTRPMRFACVDDASLPVHYSR